MSLVWSLKRSFVTVDIQVSGGEWAILKWDLWPVGQWLKWKDFFPMLLASFAVGVISSSCLMRSSFCERKPTLRQCLLPPKIWADGNWLIGGRNLHSPIEKMLKVLNTPFFHSASNYEQLGPSRSQHIISLKQFFIWEIIFALFTGLTKVGRRWCHVLPRTNQDSLSSNPFTLPKQQISIWVWNLKNSTYWYSVELYLLLRTLTLIVVICFPSVTMYTWNLTFEFVI